MASNTESESKETKELPSGDVPLPSTASALEKPEIAEEVSQSSPKKPPRDVAGIRWALVVLSILSSSFIWGLGDTIVADVQPAIVRQFASVDKLPWLPVAFLLGAASTNLFWGQCYSQFNAKYVYIFCILLFEVGSALCGAAPNINALIVGRAICGFGGAGMYTGVMVLLSMTTAENEKPIYFGLTGLSWGVGTILGPVIGGAFTDSAATWRWAFYFNLVVGAAFAPIYIFLLPSLPPPMQSSLKDHIKRIDILGAIIFIGSFSCAILAMSFGGVIFPWNGSTIIGLFVGAGVLMILFFAQQHLLINTTPATRLFPIRYLKSPLKVMLFLATACASTTVFIPVFFLPLWFQFVRHTTALQAGVYLLPYIAFTVAAGMANGIAMSKVPYYMPWYVFCGAICLLGSALLFANVDASTSPSHVWGYSILIGFGGGAFMQLGFTVIQAKLPNKEEIPLAVGFLALAQLAGPVVALSIANAVFLNDATNGIKALVPNLPPGALQIAISGSSNGVVEGVPPQLQPVVVQIVAKAMQKVYILPLTAGALTLVMGLFMKREKLVDLKQDKEETES